MRYVVGRDSRQMAMGVWSVEDEVAQESPARFIEVFVESLELDRLGLRHAVPAGTGRPAYHPGDLLKLYLYGYLNRAQLEAVERFLDGMDENDLHEDRIDHPFALDLDKDHLPDPQTLRERIAFHERCIEELENSGRSSMTFTDPECAMMPAKEGGIKACYNVQTVVDASSHMIAYFHVTNSPSDRGQIFESVEMCRKNLGLKSVNVIADKGYESAEDIERCLLNGVAADVGFIQDRE